MISAVLPVSNAMMPSTIFINKALAGVLNFGWILPNAFGNITHFAKFKSGAACSENDSMKGSYQSHQTNSDQQMIEPAAVAGYLRQRQRQGFIRRVSSR